MSMPSRFKRLLLLALSVALVALVAGCGGGGDETTGGSGGSGDSGDVNLTGDGYPNVDLASTREAKGTIDSGNVSQLKTTWTLPIKGKSTYGSYAWAPLIINGVLYSQDLASNVQAIDMESGDVIWEKTYESPSHGPNGLAVGDGHVFGVTVDSAFALDQETGEQVWKVKLTRSTGESIDMAPGLDDGKVYVSTVPVTPAENYAPGAVGTLYALDGKTGKQVWHWDTVPKSLWGKPEINSGGGLWYPPSFDAKGDVYVGTGNPGPLPGTKKFPYGSSRPGPNLYADSMVKLDPDTGKMIWYYQQTPHNIYDWDFQNPPVLVKAGGRELAIGSGKSGIVVAIDAKTGKPVWKRPVGIHNGHDKDPIYAMRKEYSKIKPGAIYPGELGGVISPVATDGKMVFVPVINLPMNAQPEAPSEIVALDVKTGAIRWNAEVTAPPYGAMTVVNDLVFATTAEGIVHAFKTETGGEVWQTALPSGTNAGVSVSGDMLIAPAGLPLQEGQEPQLVAFKLGG